VEKHNIAAVMLKCRIVVSSPRGDMPATQVCSKVKIILRAVEFGANLFVLDSKVIDVILGMDWISKKNVRPKISNFECD
jgi:hypothetical protein